MAAARQKEMNVSITEDATMRRTRSEGGATVVLLDAITKLPGLCPAACFPWVEISALLALPCGESSAELSWSQCEFLAVILSHKRKELILSKELLAVLHKADKDNNSRADQTQKKHSF